MVGFYNGKHGEYLNTCDREKLRCYVSERLAWSLFCETFRKYENGSQQGFARLSRLQNPDKRAQNLRSCDQGGWGERGQLLIYFQGKVDRRWLFTRFGMQEEERSCQFDSHFVWSNQKRELLPPDMEKTEGCTGMEKIKCWIRWEWVPGLSDERVVAKQALNTSLRREIDEFEFQITCFLVS